MNAQQQKQSVLQLRHFSRQSILLSKLKNRPPTTQFEEGFAQEDEGVASIIQKVQIVKNQQISPQKKKLLQYKFQQPKLKLTFISNDMDSKQILRRSMRNHQNNERQGQNNRSINFKKKPEQPLNYFHSCVIKITRNFVGQNLSNFNYSCQQTKKIKYHILTSGAKLVYQFVREPSTHGYLNMLQKYNKRQKSQTFFFLDSNSSQNVGQKKSSLSSKSQLNSISISSQSHRQKDTLNFLQIQKVNDLIKTKLKQTPYNYQHSKSNKHQSNFPSKAQLVFQGQFESANVQFVSRKSQFDRVYDIFLRNDTNTRGHQNWFNFRVKNNIEKSANQLDQIQYSTKFTFNIMNLKRLLQLVELGQKIYIRKINFKKSSQNFVLHQANQWILAGENFEIKQCKELDFYKSKIYKLTFMLQLQNQSEYQISLLPPYTYSQMLRDVKQIQNKNLSHSKVQILTYSLVGLAIPILTFTSNNDDSHKQVILISGRIHPGETVASYMLKGLIDKLTDNSNKETKQFLDSNIIKIIPMINPDGVVFGNFRTNYLGYDLNRSFSVEGIQNQEIILPEVCALKQLGKKLKFLYGDRFSTFIDMHGHSAQKNIFTYGPDYGSGHQNFYKARLLPKLLNTKSQYFKYNSCSFKLQQYKSCTARGFFINKLGVSAYTIEGSYGIYQTDDGSCKTLSHKQWMKFGKQLGESFQLMSRLNKSYNIKNRSQLKKALSVSQQQQIQLLKKLKKDIKKQEALVKKKEKSIKQEVKKVSIQDSDGEDQLQDISNSERLDIQKKMWQNNKINNIILPKVFKPSVLYPTVPPKLFNIGEGNTGSYKILYTRRNRYHSIKMPNNQYLHSFQGLDLLKLNTRKLQKKRQLF